MSGSLVHSLLPALTVIAVAVAVVVAVVSTRRYDASRREPDGAAADTESTPPFDSDPYLLVATWGNTYEVETAPEGGSRHRWRDRHGREIRLREPRPG